MSTRYVVEVDLETHGDLGVAKLLGGVSKLDSTVSRTTAAHSSNLDGLVSKMDGLVAGAVHFGARVAEWGAVAAIGALTYGVVSLNNHLEGTKIALGSIFEANGVASSLPAGMKTAQDTIAKMRVDAQKLPGEFEDLKGIFTTMAIPGFHAGATIDQMRGTSGKVMAFAKIAQLPMDQAAREGAQLLEGRSGAHNVLGIKLAGLAGDSAQAFNKLSEPQRFKKVGEYLDKYKSSIDEFGKSWDGVSSTTVDLAKTFLQLATEPLFEAAKGELSGINEWFTSNRGEITKFAEHLGFELRKGFYVGVETAKEWWPIVSKFAENAYDKLTSIWVDMKPYVERFGEAMKEALKDPGTLDKLIFLGKLYVAAKGASLLGGAVDFASGVGGGKGSLLSVGGLAGAAGRGVGAIAGAISPIAEAGALYGTSGALTVAANSASAALVALAPAALAVGAAFAAYEIYQGLSIAKMQAGASAADAQYRHDLGEAVYSRITILAQMGDAEQSAVDALFDFKAALDATRLSSDKTGRDITENVTDPFYLALAQQGDAIAEKQTKAAADRANAAKHPGGGGGTHIQKVEIVVTTNEEPSRVARVVEQHLANVGRRPGASRLVTNYSVR